MLPFRGCEHVAILLLATCGFGCGLEYPELSSALGKVRGTYQKSYHGRVFSAFEGVPYAKPPTGSLRFEEPVKIEPWKGVWIADRLYTCLQYGLQLDSKPHEVVGDEDCLYLNIYTPRETPKETDNLDVLVHIHGGAFMIGSGHAYTRPNYIMDREFVFVSLNYRLGSLGFLSTQDEAVPGNNGLKDQVLALKWVKQNIGSFGGNPDSITLSGFSAGAASVHYHYLSPLSEGLFHRGFSHSGSTLNLWAYQDVPKEKFRRLASSLGCLESYSSSRDVVECMKTRPGTQIVNNHKIFFGFGTCPVAPFAPVAELGSYGKAFISEHPKELLAKGQIKNVPWMVSYATSEGEFMTKGIASVLHIINKEWDSVIHHLLDTNFTYADEHKPEVAKKIKQFYIKKDKIGQEDLDALTLLLSDKLITLDVIRASRLHAKTSKSPVYNVKYNHNTKHNFMKVLIPDYDGESHVGHGDDIALLYASIPEARLTKTDEQVKDLLLDLVESYAKTNVPKVKGLKLEPESATTQHQTYLVINGPDEVKIHRDDQHVERLKFWELLPSIEPHSFKLREEL